MHERFGRYVLLELIGRGGMAEVYRAVAQGLEGFQRVFVIKRILKPKCSAPEFVEMFVNEARISALLNHPNIVQTYDFGQIDGSYFLAMEYLRGKDLLSVLRRLRSLGKQMPPQVAAYVTGQVAHGLDYAHSLSHAGKGLNIVHRDVSPSNIMLLRAGGVKLLDFGIAKAAMDMKPAGQTQVGLVKGKLSYVSPEQIRGAKVIDGRSDVFALGVVLWESLTGRRLFFDRNDYETMRNVVERPIPPPSVQRPEIPAALDYIVLKALERDPARRYPDARTMADEIDVVLQEGRFAPRAMTQLIDELFGEQSHQVEAMIGDRTPAPATSNATPNATPPMPASATLPLVDEFDEEESYTGVSSVHRMPPPPRPRWMAWLAASTIGLTLAASGVAMFARSGWRDLAELPVAPSASARAPTVAAPVPAPTPAAEEAPSPAPTTVSLKIDSDPAGAEVKSDDGVLLGVTPASLTVPRGQAPLTLVVAKPGFVPSRQAIVPDRDVSALLTLRAEPPPPKKQVGKRRRSSGRSDGRVREGLSIDPFAEDPARRK